ncbi:hypothetical protein [Streptomyces sp. NPDC058424]|uniref:hypothetical protein n=1 Tax=Streptomyces sp. NPDC058424 TaxID=3346491 RepID=UPI00365C6CEF
MRAELGSQGWRNEPTQCGCSQALTIRFLEEGVERRRPVRTGAGVPTAFVMTKRLLSSAPAIDVLQSIDGGVARDQKVGLRAGCPAAAKDGRLR